MGRQFNGQAVGAATPAAFLFLYRCKGTTIF